MITRVHFRSAQNELLVIQLDDLSSGYILSEVENLEPGKATLVSTSFVNVDGANYQASRREPRNIKLKFKYVPFGASVSSRRNYLYKFFMPKTTVFMEFHMDDETIMKISGKVEAFEGGLFVQEPEANISIMCFDPDFYESEPTVYSGNSVSTNDTFEIDYGGTVDTGFVLEVSPNRSVSAVSVYHIAIGITQVLTVNYPLTAGQKLVVETTPGQKRIELVSGGFSQSILYGLLVGSSWPQLIPGSNLFGIYIEGDPVPFTLSYIGKHGGL